MEQKVFETEQYNELKGIIEKFKDQDIFLVRANKSYYNSGADVFIKTLLSENRVVSFSEFDPNPQLEDLKKGVNHFKNGNFKLIVAIGGGSVLDMAKLISVFAHQDTEFEDVVRGKKLLVQKNTPLLAIPTTAGTGAEATQFAVLYMDKVKYSVAGKNLLPEYVYLSAKFSLSASAYLTACTGLDAFSQAMESLWSVNATTESEKFAVNALELVWNNLALAVNSNNLHAKNKMQEASFLAGKAINITKTTAPHALSYAFTSYYGIPHGHAVAITLPYFLHYNYNLSDEDCIDPNGVMEVKRRIEKLLNILNVNIDHAADRIIDFFKSLGISINVREIIKEFDPNMIINNVNIERLSNNPRKVSEKDIARIFSE